MTHLDSVLKKQTPLCRHRPSQNYDFSSSHVWMWELDHKESWTPMNWCFQIVVLKKTLESPLDCKKIQPVHPKGNQPWIFIGRNNAEAETPILWPPDAKSGLIGKDPDGWERLRAGGERGWQTMRMLDCIINSMDINLSKLKEIGGEGNGNPLQCSCLENPRDGGARWAAVYGVAQSQTWLKWLNSSRSREIGGSDGKVSACNVGDLGSIPGSGRSCRDGNGNPLQSSCLENSMDWGAW